MGQEQIKVLEMVAAGKISPEDGERLLNALNGNSGGSRSRSSYGGRGNGGFDFGELNIPNIDVAKLAEKAVELRKSVMETAKTVEGKLKRSKASKYFEPKDYPISVERGIVPDGPVSLDLSVQAGQLKVLGDMDEDGKLLVGRATRVPDAPTISGQTLDGRQQVSLRHSLGSCWLRLSDTPTYSIKLDNAAADTRLELVTLKADSLKLSNNAGNLDVRLGDRLPHIEVEIVNNAGSVDLTVDGGYALKIHSSGSLSSSNIENLGLSLVDGSYVSPDWQENPRSVEILLAQNVASFSISWRGAKKAPKMIGVSIGSVTLGADEEDETETGSSTLEAADAGLAEADALAEEANAAVSQVQADIEKLGRAVPPAEPGSSGSSSSGSTSPSAARGDLPSSDL